MTPGDIEDLLLAYEADVAVWTRTPDKYNYAEVVANRKKIADLLEARTPQEATGARWIPVSERLPESGVPVLAHITNSHGKTRRLRAQWIAKHTYELWDGDDMAGDYSEETDTTYTPEGWYETNEYEETHFHINDPVSHWTPLPPGPDQASAPHEPSEDARDAARYRYLRDLAGNGIMRLLMKPSNPDQWDALIDHDLAQQPQTKEIGHE